MATNLGRTARPHARSLWGLLILILILGPAAGGVFGDYITLTSGRTVYGEIIAETSDSVTIRTEINGIPTTITYRRSVIAHYVIDEDRRREQRDEEEPEPEVVPASDPSPQPERDRGAAVVVIPLHGQVGGLNRGRVQGTFDADMLRACFEEAKRLRAAIVILDINSPGGYVYEMEEIAQTIINWHPHLRIVAYPREAYSAAAVIALACRELAVRHDSMIGAAVMARGGSALDAKHASPHHARQRRFMAASGKPYALLQAMTIQETELWWSFEGGFLTQRPPASEADAWEQVTGRTTVLTMTGEQSRRWGVADFSAGSLQTLLMHAGVREPYTIHTLSGVMEDHARQTDRRLEQLERDFTNYFVGLAELRDAIETFIKAKDDRQARQRARADVRRSHGKVMNSGRSIRQSERSLLARRVSLPEDIITRLEEDGQLLGMVRRLVDSDSPEGLGEATARFNAVINAWRQLLR